MATKKEEAKTDAKREEFKVSGGKIVDKIKELIKEGNVRRIIIANEKGETIMELPLTFAVVGTALAPVLAAVGALAPVSKNISINLSYKYRDLGKIKTGNHIVADNGLSNTATSPILQGRMRTSNFLLGVAVSF